MWARVEGKAYDINTHKLVKNVGSYEQAIIQKALDDIGPEHCYPMPKFPNLNSYDNYSEGVRLPSDLHEIPMDGTIRIIKRKLIEYRKIVRVEKHKGQYYPRTTGYVIHVCDLERLDEPEPKPPTKFATRRLLTLIRDSQSEVTQFERRLYERNRQRVAQPA